MTRFLYLVRHGDASPHDGPLSEAGREQARLAGQRLREVPLAHPARCPAPGRADRRHHRRGILRRPRVRLGPGRGHPLRSRSG
ncbi:MAG: histidine phosphatase family protein [Streptosporangiaceae bacterium]